MREMKELRENASDDFVAEPLPDTMFEWHFTIRGPPETEFHGGRYHGRILLPSDYPFKPPDIIMLTVSHTKFCTELISPLCPYQLYDNV